MNRQRVLSLVASSCNEATEPADLAGMASAGWFRLIQKMARRLLGGAVADEAGEETMNSTTFVTQPDRGLASHPNEFDCRRIARILEGRRRYRYVAPAVMQIPGGYRIESPCCSRNVDAAGGVIDIARIEPLVRERTWLLYRLDHALRAWIVYGTFESLNAVLEVLNEDPDRLFWP
jgi:hypothetical protein